MLLASNRMYKKDPSLKKKREKIHPLETSFNSFQTISYKDNCTGLNGSSLPVEDRADEELEKGRK